MASLPGTGSYSLDALAALVRPLRAFRYCGAFGGHANDGDALSLRLGPLTDLPAIGLALGLDATTLAQPGWTTLCGQRVFVAIDARGLTLTLAGADGDPYAVTGADVAAGVAIEAQRLDAVAAYVIDPPEGHDRCFCPERFPAWFGSAA